MTDYQAPLDDMRFMINEVLNADRIRALPDFGDFDADTQDAILEEAGRFAAGELAPLNAVGDQQGASWHDTGVTAPDGFATAYAHFAEAGWNSLTAAPQHGGMGMPMLLEAACSEMWNAANMSFALCPLLTASAIKLLSSVGSEAQQRMFLDKMVSGQWTGTMDLTEPQAGSDLGAIRTRAIPDGDHYRLFGQKIFITWGEHDMAENIVHLVLARLPDAPEGVKGISLFAVPRYLVNENGSLGQHNDMRCAAIEHKLGIHASPTCTMAYGDTDGAIGYLVGEPHRGLNYMFIMMNQARQKMGSQALGVAEAACQHAVTYARNRVQGKPAVTDAPQGATIVYHPDVRRMLLGMRSQIDVMRALAYDSAAQMDMARGATGERERLAAQARVDVLIPITKAWITEVATEIVSTGIQVHGGTLLLDEIGELPQALQVKLLRVLQEGEIRRVGESGSREVDVRIVAATARELETEVKTGTFRSDLFYRINVVRIHLPPLRHRTEDIPALVRHFIDRCNQTLGLRVTGVAPAAMERLLGYPWPGNIRELENVVERAMVLTDGEQIRDEHLPESIREPGVVSLLSLDTLPPDELSVKKRTAELERRLIWRALEITGGNRTRAAEMLELSYRALLYKIRDYGLDDVGKKGAVADGAGAAEDA